MDATTPAAVELTAAEMRRLLEALRALEYSSPEEVTAARKLRAALTAAH